MLSTWPSTETACLIMVTHLTLYISTDFDCVSTHGPITNIFKNVSLPPPARNRGSVRHYSQLIVFVGGKLLSNRGHVIAQETPTCWSGCIGTTEPLHVLNYVVVIIYPIDKAHYLTFSIALKYNRNACSADKLNLHKHLIHFLVQPHFTQ